MPRVYVSFRREDSAATAHKIVHYLTEQGITCMGGEEDTRLSKREIKRDIGHYDAIFVVIGPKWATVQNRFGFASLFEPNDPTRVLIEAALAAERPIFPVLVDGATIPAFDRVPGSILPLLHSKPIILRRDHFQGDLDELAQIFQPRPPAGHQVFISYSRKDAAAMTQVRDGLRAAGLTVWVDEEGLKPGTGDWENAVGRAIRATGCVVVILSPDAEQSVWVRRELAMADLLGKQIFPMLVRGDEKDAIPLSLMLHQWVDGRGDRAGGIGKLSAAVQGHLKVI